MTLLFQIALGLWLGFLFITGTVWAFLSARERLETRARRRRTGIA